jgi:hypothetical protein
VILSSELGRTQPERSDQIAVGAKRSETVDARLQLSRHRCPRDDGTMQPPDATQVSVNRRVEQLAEVHLALVGESLRQGDPPTDIVRGLLIHADYHRSFPRS